MTPADRGYRMPAEWEPHESTWLSWPTNQVTWPGELLEVVREAYVSMIRFLIPGEPVNLLVDDETFLREVSRRIALKAPDGNRLQVHVVPTIDGWIRDYGPNFLVHPQDRAAPVAFNNWRFNAWGGKYEDLALDDRVPDQLALILQMPQFRPGLVMEGGSIEVNGRGLCLTTRQCLLNPNRNPQLGENGIESVLRNYLGVHEVIWLEQGIEGDDTDGHIDDIARFVAKDKVVCAREEDPTDANYEVLLENFNRLQRIGTDRGLFQVIGLPMPEAVTAGSDRLPASYANFYIANRLVLVPVFGQTRDELALEILRGVFPGREVVGIPASEMVYGLGAIHCLTQQQPAAPARD